MDKPGHIVIRYGSAYTQLCTWLKVFFLLSPVGYIIVFFIGQVMCRLPAAFMTPGYIVTLVGAIMYFANDLLRRRVILRDDHIDYGFHHMPLSDLTSIKLSYRLPGFYGRVHPDGMVLNFAGGTRYDFKFHRMSAADLRLLVKTIQRRVQHCKIDPIVLNEASQEMYERRQINKNGQAARTELDYRPSRLLEELLETLHGTVNFWLDQVGPLGTFVLATPLWLFCFTAAYWAEYFKGLKDFQQGQIPIDTDALYKLIGIMSDGIWAFVSSISAAAVALIANPIQDCIIAMFASYLAIQFFRAYFAPNRLTIDKDGISLDRFFEVSSNITKQARWDDVYQAALIMPPGAVDPAAAMIVLKDREARPLMSISLAALQAKDRKKLSLAITEATHCKVEAQLSEALDIDRDKSYTELWLQSLAAPERQNFEPLEPNHKLQDGRYRISSKLAVGGEGIAYLAIDEHVDAGAQPALARVVLKELLLPPFRDKEVQEKALERFEKEARLLKSLDSQYIVGLRDYFIEDHRCYLALEFVQGANLRQYVAQNGAMKEIDVLLLATQMAEMLVVLHKARVIHRDFTPDNLMRQEGGGLRLIDFNVVSVDTTPSRSATIVGKHAYVPPEQFRGKPTAQSDIYAFGATLFFLLTAADPEPITQSQPAQIKPAISQYTNALIADCTAIDLSQRVQAAEQLLTRLEECRLLCPIT